MDKNTAEINNRYSKIADNTINLSCGKAVIPELIKNGHICVDLGCGTGKDLIYLSGITGNNGFVYGIDITDKMVEKAIENTQKYNNIKVIKADLTDIPLNNNSIDYITSNCVINHASDKLKAWKEINRILKKGGIFTISDIYSINIIEDKYKNDPALVSQCWAGAVTKKEYIDTLNNAGFFDIAILNESEPYNKEQSTLISFTIKGTKRG